MKETLCWKCANAVPDAEGKYGCNWSRKFEPVAGWEIEESTRTVGVYQNGKKIEIKEPSLSVISCPEFKKEETNG